MTFAVALAASSAVLALYVAALNQRFARAPGWRDQRWFSAVALAIACYEALNIPVSVSASDDVVLAVSRLQLLFVALNPAAWLLHSGAHLDRRGRRWDAAGAACLAALGLLSLAPGAVFVEPVRRTTFAPLGLSYAVPTTTALGDAFLAVTLGVLGLVTARYALAWRRRTRYAGTHLVALCVFFLFVANDVLVAAGAYEAPYVFDLAILLPVAAVGYSLTARFAEDAQALTDLRARLERVVEQRTRELTETQVALHRAEKLAALTQFSAGVAHEVNNPAAVVGANLKYLDDSLAAGELPPDARECVRDSIASMDRISGIIRQLLDAGRLAATKTPLEPVAVAGCAREAIAMARARIPARIAVRLAIDESLLVHARQEVLAQVLVNLVVNGAQAVPEPRSGHVSIRAERVDGRVRIAVEDDGSGMDRATLSRIFEPFFSTKPIGVGTGLGLAVSRGLVAGFGGTLALESVPGRGTRALIELAEAQAVAGRLEAASVAPLGRRRSLLLLEEDPAALAALVRVLEPHYAVCATGAPDEALALADARRPDLVLCDGAAGGAGSALARALEEHLPALAGRIVLLADGGTPPGSGDAAMPGPQPVLRRPLDLHALHALARIAERLAPGEEAASEGAAWVHG